MKIEVPVTLLHVPEELLSVRAKAIETSAPKSTSATILNGLIASSWDQSDFEPADWTPVLAHSLAYVCAYYDRRLIGFVNVAWEGAFHAFILNTTVHPDMRRRGIGTELVKRAAEVARERGVEWLHVDYQPELEDFYRGCGFAHTSAGLMQLN